MKKGWIEVGEKNEVTVKYQPMKYSFKKMSIVLNGIQQFIKLGIKT